MADTGVVWDDEHHDGVVWDDQAPPADKGPDAPVTTGALKAPESFFHS